MIDGLSARGLQARLSLMLPEMPGEHEKPGFQDAAVLVPMLEVDGQPSLLFTRRSEELPEHSGQVAFPGGIREKDDPGLYQTALREAVEEVDVLPDEVERVGALPAVSTMRKYRIHPFVSVWGERTYQPASPEEVSRVFTVPLVWLLDEGNDGVAELSYGGQDLRVPAWLWDGEVIWGATRRITQSMLSAILAAL